MKSFFIEKNMPPLIKFIIALVLFISIKDFNSIDSFSKLAVALLELIIILELVRMLIEFLLSDENRIRMRLMIDSTIVFFIRDIMLIVNDTFDSKKIFAILGIIAILFAFRIFTVKYSPSFFEKEYTKKEIDE
ncbi:phosphate-starvation-inducible PsiE family protein [Arcobacter sp. YIC-80]|uniref:phosphate-starvation-inducible PsiE family protein n=1 Tax=Arcobacter sp. YIC-80 TaxID=3376683 RepID=UPI00384E330C